MDQFLRTGATIDVFDSATLAILDPTGLTLGTVVYVTSLASDFTLTKSTAALSPDQVVAVFGIDGYRWIKGGGAGGGTWLASASQYVSPDGNDTNDGSGWTTPKKTFYAATKNLLSTSAGGTVYFASGSEFGGPVPGQGLWLSNTGSSTPESGFLELNNHAMRFVGVGGGANQYVFEPAGPVWATSNNAETVFKDQFHPDIWIVGAEVPISFEYLKSFEPFNNWLGVYAPVRLGWDYVRNVGYQIEWLNVTSASRSASAGTYDQTTYTLDMSGANTWQIIGASRTLINGVWTVTVIVSRPATISCGPWTFGSVLRFVSTDSNFPSGDYAVTFYDDVLTPGPTRTTIALRWVDGQTAPADGDAIGTVQSHGAAAGDKITAQFANANFQSACMYTVTAATWDTITVNDPYAYLGGGTPATGTNIGAVVKQVRGKLVASAVTIDHCSLAGHISAGDNVAAGPTLDLGGTSASYCRIEKSYFSGGANFDFSGLTEFQIDPDRTLVAVLGNTGSGSTNSNSIIAIDNQSQSGGMRWYGSINGGELYVDHWLGDFTAATIPVVHVVNPGGYSSGFIDHITQADGTVVGSAVVIDDGHDGRSWRVGTVLGKVDARNTIGPIIADNLYASNGAKSPWETGSQGFWLGGVSARHPGASRAMGVTGARYANMWPPPDTWNNNHTVGFSFTPAPAPDGSNTAVLITNASAIEPCVCGTEPFVIPGLAAGDYLIFGTWINLGGNIHGNKPLQIYTPDGTVVLSNGLDLGPQIVTDGWQWVTSMAKVADAGNASVGRWIDVPANGGHVTVWGTTFIRVPGSVAPIDVYELAGTLRHQPYYLAAGMSGTMEGQQIIAHGGLGIDASVPKVAGVGSGQLTVGAIVTYEPRFAADGVTVIGWAPLYAATVNP